MSDGFTASHTSTYGVPVTSTYDDVSACEMRHSLRALDEMVDEHAETATGTGPEVEHGLGEMVETVEPFDHDAFGAQVVAPHLLDELGVVDAFDEHAAGLGDARLGARRRRTPTRSVWARRFPSRAAARA